LGFGIWDLGMRGLVMNFRVLSLNPQILKS